LGAVVTTPEIASVMAQKIQFNTFGGNPVCSAGGLAVLKVLDKEKRQAHCADVGAHLVERLKTLQQKHESKMFPPSYDQFKQTLLFMSEIIC
jgi:alanine-glyoxylate transaminase/(R)-3-amino-2-methylpropionate-pyruvate transaminase